MEPALADDSVDNVRKLLRMAARCVLSATSQAAVVPLDCADLMSAKALVDRFIPGWVPLSQMVLVWEKPRSACMIVQMLVVVLRRAGSAENLVESACCFSLARSLVYYYAAMSRRVASPEADGSLTELTLRAAVALLRSGTLQCLSSLLAARSNTSEDGVGRSEAFTLVEITLRLLYELNWVLVVPLPAHPRVNALRSALRIFLRNALAESQTFEHVARALTFKAGCGYFNDDKLQTAFLNHFRSQRNWELLRSVAVPGTSLQFLLTAMASEVLHDLDGGSKYGLSGAAIRSRPIPEQDLIWRPSVLRFWTTLLAPGTGLPQPCILRPPAMYELCMRVSTVCVGAVRSLDAGRQPGVRVAPQAIALAPAVNKEVRQLYSAAAVAAALSAHDALVAKRQRDAARAATAAVADRGPLPAATAVVVDISTAAPSTPTQMESLGSTDTATTVAPADTARASSAASGSGAARGLGTSGLPPRRRRRPLGPALASAPLASSQASGAPVAAHPSTGSGPSSPASAVAAAAARPSSAAVPAAATVVGVPYQTDASAAPASPPPREASAAAVAAAPHAVSPAAAARPVEWWRAGVAALAATVPPSETEDPEHGGEGEVGEPYCSEEVAALARCQLSWELQPPVLLPPNPPPDVAAALSADFLPTLERLLRHVHRPLSDHNKRDDPPAHHVALLAAVFNWSSLSWLLAYGDQRQAAALLTTLTKLLWVVSAKMLRFNGGGYPDDDQPDLLQLSARLVREGLDWAAARQRAMQQQTAAASGSDGGSKVNGRSNSISSGEEGAEAAEAGPSRAPPPRRRRRRAGDGASGPSPEAAGDPGRQLLRLLSYAASEWLSFWIFGVWLRYNISNRHPPSVPQRAHLTRCALDVLRVLGCLLDQEDGGDDSGGGSSSRGHGGTDPRVSGGRPSSARADTWRQLVAENTELPGHLCNFAGAAVQGYISAPKVSAPLRRVFRLMLSHCPVGMQKVLRGTSGTGSGQGVGAGAFTTLVSHFRSTGAMPDPPLVQLLRAVRDSGADAVLGRPAPQSASSSSAAAAATTSSSPSPQLVPLAEARGLLRTCGHSRCRNLSSHSEADLLPQVPPSLLQSLTGRMLDAVSYCCEACRLRDSYSGNYEATSWDGARDRARRPGGMSGLRRNR